MRQIITGPPGSGKSFHYVEPAAKKYSLDDRPYILFTNKRGESTDCGAKMISLSELRGAPPEQKGYRCVLAERVNDRLSVEDIMHIIGKFVRSGIFPNIIIDEMPGLCGINTLPVIEFLKEYSHGDVILVIQSMKQITPVTEAEKYVSYLNTKYDYIMLSKNKETTCIRNGKE